MAKIKKSNQIIKPFEGFIFVIDQIDNPGISQIFDNQLGKSQIFAKFV